MRVRTALVVIVATTLIAILSIGMLFHTQVGYPLVESLKIGGYIFGAVMLALVLLMLGSIFGVVE